MTINQNQRSQRSDNTNDAPENKIDKYAQVFFIFHKYNFMLNLLTLQVMVSNKKTGIASFLKFNLAISGYNIATAFNYFTPSLTN